MAMIDCRGCGKKVSDGLPYCPSCGEVIPRRLAPFETPSLNPCARHWRFARNGFIGIFLFLVCYGLLGLFFESPHPSILTPVLLAASLSGVIFASRRLKKNVEK